MSFGLSPFIRSLFTSEGPKPTLIGKPGQYKQYNVFGQTYDKIDGKTPNLGDKIKTGVIHSLLSGIANVAPSSDQAIRTYKDVVLDRKKTSLSERDFTAQELDYLYQVIEQAERNGKTGIGRKDYVVRDKNGKRIRRPFGIGWESVLGKADFKRDPETGDIIITDNYDFNNYEAEASRIHSQEAGEVGPAAWLGRRALPAGIRQVPISIRLKKRK